VKEEPQGISETSSAARGLDAAADSRWKNESGSKVRAAALQRRLDDSLTARRNVDDGFGALVDVNAMNTLKGAMADRKAPWSAKITAAIAVLDRGWGNPEQTVSTNVSVFDQMTDDGKNDARCS
jgi:hypothetical protein